jgi:hypothetical protein
VEVEVEEEEGVEDEEEDIHKFTLILINHANISH